jgi:TetR/AcrR family tetracycline transcriptional repressor
MQHTDTENVKGHLQREGIARTALNLMDKIGLDALTLRRLAQELHVKAPALYWHFKNKQELLNEMAQAMLFSSYPPESVTEQMAQYEWSEWLIMMGTGLRNALLMYSDGARLLATADVSKGTLLGLDLALGVLVNAGFGYQEALLGVSTVVNYTLGISLEEQSSSGRAEAMEYFRELIRSNNLPHVTAALGADVEPPDSDAEFEAGLRLIIAGLRTQHVSNLPKPPQRRKDQP